MYMHITYLDLMEFFFVRSRDIFSASLALACLAKLSRGRRKQARHGVVKPIYFNNKLIGIVLSKDGKDQYLAAAEKEGIMGLTVAKLERGTIF